MSKKYVDLDGLSHFKAKADNEYVAKETGKGLSTNDYTTEEKNKLNGVETGAEANIIESIVVNGTTATIENKTATVTVDAGSIDSISVNNTPQTVDANKNVNITVPTKTSDLTNDDNVVKDASYVHTDNNFTNELKTKAENAEANVIETVKVNGTAQTVTSKEIDITVPTNNNQLTNGAGYQTASDVESAINSKLSTVMDYKGEVNTYADLPANPKKGDVYNITTADSTHGVKAGDNVAYNGTTWDVLAGTFDTTGLVKEEDLIAITNAEIDTIFDN